MLIHFAIAHYFNPNGGGKHGSLSSDPLPRIDALRESILQLHRNFGSPSGILNHMQRRVDIVKDNQDLKITICINKDNHILDELSDLEEAGAFEKAYYELDDPKKLGFKCHKELEIKHKEYDFNCYLEDDIIVNDGYFFKKLSYFNKSFGNHYLLQPNRKETSTNLKNIRKFYIDGDYNPKRTEKYRNSMHKELSMQHLGEVVIFKQPFNCHSGCFFLNVINLINEEYIL